MNMCCAMRIECELEEELDREREREGARVGVCVWGREEVYCG